MTKLVLVGRDSSAVYESDTLGSLYLDIRRRMMCQTSKAASQISTIIK